MGILSKLLGTKAAAVREEAAAGVTKVQLLAALSSGKAQINKLIDLSNEVASTKFADLITDVAFAMRAIYEDLERDPRDLKVAEDFIVYHAPKAVDVIILYAKSEQNGGGTADEREVAEKAMRQMKTSFEILLAKCRENDDEGFAVQTETLRRILELETPTLKSCVS